MAPLTGDQKRRLHAMLREAFSQQDLRELFFFYLETPLDDIISPNDDARAVALKVITVSEREGTLPALLRAVADERRARQDIQALVAELLTTVEVAAAPPVSPPDAPTPEPSPRPDDASRTTHHASRPDPLLITTPIRMEFVLVDDGRPLRMGTPPGQVQEMLRRFDWAKEWDMRRGFRCEQPASSVYVAPFAVGRYPVTNAQYAVFLGATHHPAPARFGDWSLSPAGREDYPVVNISWHDAVAFAAWLSRESGRVFRLPTEAEWEKAARGADGRLWPWGDQWDLDRANTWEANNRGTTPVGRYSPQGDSPFGAADMAGNVWEWCSTSWREDYTTSMIEEPGDEQGRVVRGGSWDSTQSDARCACRTRSFPLGLNNLGFRVVLI